MIVLYAILFPLCLAGFVWLVKSRKNRKRLVRLSQEPMPQSWKRILKANVPLFERIAEDERTRLIGAMHVFLDEKRFEGCGGLEITEEVRVTIAAQACMLLMGHNMGTYPRLKSILVYPDTYESGQKGLFGGDNGVGARLGESWNTGVVVLAWDSVLGGARNLEDGHNVTFHEFAHQLDQEDGAADGAPILENRSAYSTWARVFQHEYKELVDETQRGRKSTMDQYGATNPAEFFAVVTETFFEKPHQLQDKHPELYEELQSYYRLDPMKWISG